MTIFMLVVFIFMFYDRTPGSEDWNLLGIMILIGLVLDTATRHIWGIIQ